MARANYMQCPTRVEYSTTVVSCVELMYIRAGEFGADLGARDRDLLFLLGSKCNTSATKPHIGY
jgi:hypothetical protein